MEIENFIKKLNCNYEKDFKGRINFYFMGILFSIKLPKENENGYIKYKNRNLSDTFFKSEIKDYESFKNNFKSIAKIA